MYLLSVFIKYKWFHNTCKHIKRNEKNVVIEIGKCEKVFFFLCWPSLDIFFTTSYGLYFSQHYTYYKFQSFTHINHMPERQIHIGIIFQFQLIIYSFSFKNFLPCWDLNLGHPKYQADALPIEISRLGKC